MSVIDKFLGSRDDFDEFDDYEDDYEPKRNRNVKEVREQKEIKSKDQVIVIKPKSIADGKVIADHLLKGSAVVINLLGMETNVAQRVIDFVSGSCYCIDGNLEKINEQMIIVTPKRITLSGDFLERDKRNTY